MLISTSVFPSIPPALPSLIAIVKVPAFVIVAATSVATKLEFDAINTLAGLNNWIRAKNPFVAVIVPTRATIVFPGTAVNVHKSA